MKKIISKIAILFTCLGLSSCSLLDKVGDLIGSEANSIDTVKYVSDLKTKPTFDAYKKLENGSGNYKYYYFNMGTVDGIPLVTSEIYRYGGVEIEATCTLKSKTESEINDAIGDAIEKCIDVPDFEDTGIVLTSNGSNNVYVTTTTKSNSNSNQGSYFKKANTPSTVNTELSKKYDSALYSVVYDDSTTNINDETYGGAYILENSNNSSVKNAYETYSNSAYFETKTSSLKLQAGLSSGCYRYATFCMCDVYAILVLNTTNNEYYVEYQLYPLEKKFYNGIQYSENMNFDEGLSDKITLKLNDVKDYLAFDCDNTEEAEDICTVVFNTNGGSSVSSKAVKYGAKVTEPSNPTRSGYTFKGWYKDSSLTNKYSFNEIITSDITLYAKWEKTSGTSSQCIVTFNSEGGSTVSNKTVKSGSTISAPTNPTRTNCVFAGWYTSYNYETEFNFNSSITSDITLYAKWIVAKSDILSTKSSSKIFTDGVSIYLSMGNISGIDIYYLENCHMIITDISNNYVCAEAQFTKVAPNNYIKNGTTISKWDFFFDTTCCNLSYWRNNNFTYNCNFTYDAIVLPNELK